MTKWGKQFWTDLAERVGSTIIAAVIAVLTANANGVVSTDPKAWWTLVGLPAVLVLLKGVLANLSGSQASASLVGVSSTRKRG